MTGLFMGAGTDPRGAGLTLIGAPVDDTVAIRAGCRSGPARIRAVSGILEDYSVQLGCGYGEQTLADVGDIDPLGGPDGWLPRLADETERLCRVATRPLWLGGEHLLSLGAVTGARRVYPDLFVLVLDAHADLRDSYLGMHLSHATVARRIFELVGSGSLVQAGVRSGTADEVRFRDQAAIPWLDMDAGLPTEIRRLAGDRPIYLSVDIDVFDPAHAPGTGSPEPGGPSAAAVLAVIAELARGRFVAGDVVELSPGHDQSDVTALLAARIVRDLAALLSSSPFTPCADEPSPQ